MAKWTSDDIDLASELLALWNQSATPADFYKSADLMVSRHKESLIAQSQAQRAEWMATSYHRLLSTVGGDASYLAKMLYMHIVETRFTAHRATRPRSPKSGRPPETWGSDGAGKLMLYFCVEEIMQQMRAEDIARPKIRDAIARGLGIARRQRGRVTIEKEIDDYASRYSEAKKILKGRV
ncbi:MAG: hypothetical protein KBF41_15955 [Azonexus sp.]|jgi:hypothetical protein|nr:hypothetical protein [Azonexus sp.]